MICPACGELVIAWLDPSERARLIPAHPDRITPFTDCTLAVVLDGTRLP